MYSFSPPWFFAHSFAREKSVLPIPCLRQSWETWILDKSIYCPRLPRRFPSRDANPFSFPSWNAPNTAPPVASVLPRHSTKKAYSSGLQSSTKAMGRICHTPSIFRQQWVTSCRRTNWENNPREISSADSARYCTLCSQIRYAGYAPAGRNPSCSASAAEAGFAASQLGRRPRSKHSRISLAQQALAKPQRRQSSRVSTSISMPPRYTE